MNDAPLTPYGHSAPGVRYSGPPQDHHQRAQQKLQSIRSGASGDAPVSFPTARIVRISILMLFLASPFMLISFAMGMDGELGVALVVSLFWIAALSVPVVMALRSSTKQPVRALREYYRELSAGRHQRAREILTLADQDHAPRVQPYVANLGSPTGYGYSFDDPNGFQLYWDGLLRSHVWPYCLPRVTRTHVTELAPDVVLVRFRLQMMMNTRLWVLAFLIIGIFAIVADAVTRKTVKADLCKVLVRVGDEWKVFNGEWQGYDELDLAWLE